MIDGHHRAALARRRRAETIDADVTELVARVPRDAFPSTGCLRLAQTVVSVIGDGGRRRRVRLRRRVGHAWSWRH